MQETPMISRRQLTALAVTFVAFPSAFRAAQAATPATLYKTPGCECCGGYAHYLRLQGFTVTEVESEELPQLREKHGVPDALVGCHMTFVGGYLLEGHVPLSPIKKLLAEKPRIKGISLPGMPAGSPGMGGAKAEPFVIYEIAQGEPKIFARD